MEALWSLEDLGTAWLHDTVLHPKTLEYSATFLWEPQVSHRKHIFLYSLITQSVTIHKVTKSAESVITVFKCNRLCSVPSVCKTTGLDSKRRLEFFFTNLMMLQLLRIDSICFTWTTVWIEALVECYWWERIKILGEKFVSLPLCLLQTSCGLASDQTATSAVTRVQLTAWHGSGELMMKCIMINNV